MKAIQITQYGDPNVLKLEEVPKPSPGKGEVLVAIKAVGLNFIDIYMRTGYYPRPLPFIPGLEGAGIVEEIGDDVTEVKVGDRVAYVGAIGSYAEYTIVKASQLITIPASLSFDEAAAFPLQGLTAHYLLHEFYQIKKGDTVLVHAAAGGMGLLLVQWIKHLGGIVIGTVSTPEKADLARKAGADHVILYTKEDFAVEANKITKDKGVEYIIDGVGKTTFPKNMEAIKRRGHICIYGSASGPADPISPNILQTKSIKLWGGSLFNYMDTREEILNRANAVLEAIKEGWLSLRIDQRFPLEKAAEAQSRLENRNSAGKVILTV